MASGGPRVSRRQGKRLGPETGRGHRYKQQNSKNFLGHSQSAEVGGGPQRSASSYYARRVNSTCAVSGRGGPLNHPCETSLPEWHGGNLWLWRSRIIIADSGYHRNRETRSDPAHVG